MNKTLVESMRDTLNLLEDDYDIFDVYSDIKDMVCNETDVIVSDDIVVRYCEGTGIDDMEDEELDDEVDSIVGDIVSDIESGRLKVKDGEVIDEDGKWDSDPSPLKTSNSNIDVEQEIRARLKGVVAKPLLDKIITIAQQYGETQYYKGYESGIGQGKKEGQDGWY